MASGVQTRGGVEDKRSIAGELEREPTELKVRKLMQAERARGEGP